MKTKTFILRTVAVGVWLLLSTTPGLAAGFEKTIPATDLKECLVLTRSGDIKIIGWDKSQVRIESKEPVAFKQSAGRLKLGQEDLSGSGRSDQDMTVHLPRKVELEITTISGDVVVEGLRGRQEIKAISGDLRLADCHGRIRLKTVSGEIDTRGLEGELKLVSISGSVRLEQSRTSQLEAKSVSGDVRIQGEGAHMELKSHSGDVTFNGSLAPEADVSIKTFSGDVDVHLPANATFELKAKSRSGSVVVEHALQAEEKGEHSLAGRAGSGGAELELNSFSGDLSVRKSN